MQGRSREGKQTYIYALFLDVQKAYDTVSNYADLEVNFASNGAGGSHVNDVCVNGRKKVNQFHSVLSNRDINLCACRLLLLSVVRPSIEYGSAVGIVIRIRLVL